MQIKEIVALDGVTATTTSGKHYVGGHGRLGIRMNRADHGSGSSTFSIKGSLQDESTVTPTMTAINLWIDNVTNTNAEMITRVNEKALGANGDEYLWLDPSATVNWLEITVTEVSDGTHSAWIVWEPKSLN